MSRRCRDDSATCARGYATSTPVPSTATVRPPRRARRDARRRRCRAPCRSRRTPRRARARGELARDPSPYAVARRVPTIATRGDVGRSPGRRSPRAWRAVTVELARTAADTQGRCDGIVSTDTRPFSCRGAATTRRRAARRGPVRPAALIGKAAERVGRLDRRRFVVAEQVHLREDDAVRLFGELRGVRLDLARGAGRTPPASPSRRSE